MVCDCDPHFGEFCIIEIGSDVEFTDHYKQLWGQDDSHEVWMPIHNLNEEVETIGDWYDGPREFWGRERRNLLAALPEFRLKGDPHCPSGNS